MAQSTSESNVRGIPSFWQNITMDPTIPLVEWSDYLQLDIKAKLNGDIEILLNPIKRNHPHPPALENPMENEQQKPKKSTTREEYTRTKTL